MCRFTFEVMFKRFFAPPSQSWKSKFLEIWNPLGKVTERSSLRFKLLLINGVKLLHEKSLFGGKFCLTGQDFFGISDNFHIDREIL